MGTGRKTQDAWAYVTSTCVVCVMTCALSFSSCVACAASSKDRAVQALAHYIVGFSYDLMGQTAAAMSEFEETVRLDPMVKNAHLQLGIGYAQSEDQERAVLALTRALELEPQDLRARYALALVYAAQNDFPKAALEYEFILKGLVQGDPRNADLLIYLGQLYYAQGMMDKAIEQFQQVLVLDPRNTDVLYAVSGYYLDKGRRSEAEALLKRCVDVDPVHDGCLNALSYIYAEDGKNLDEAQKLILQALVVSPDNAAYLDTLGWVYYQKGLYMEALKEVARAESLQKDPAIHDHLGDVYHKLGQDDMARKFWRLSLDADPDQLAIRAKLSDLDKAQALNQQQ